MWLILTLKLKGTKGEKKVKPRLLSVVWTTSFPEIAVIEFPSELGEKHIYKSEKLTTQNDTCSKVKRNHCFY